MTPLNRFDDLRPGRKGGFALGEPSEVLVAHRLEDVEPILEAAEDRVQRGMWVAGWVAYEAAPAFDASLRVRDTARTQLESLPLAWFTVARKRRPVPVPSPARFELSPWDPSIDPAQFRSDIEVIRGLIENGHTYQVNHTFRLSASFSGDPHAYYRQLIASQSCGYGAFVDAGDWVVASASPELFFEWKDDRLTCRPMKGTTRRGTDPVDDETQRVWLENSEKNRAENLMIVDMVRNDLGKVARVGTVRVPALFTTEKYDTVWQLTSTVTARPQPQTGLVDVFAALFPSASITGAPKVSTMGIIQELETLPRGVYCGAIGFGGPTPRGPEWAFNVGIRTVTIDRRSGRAHYGTGGGITYDSEPADEHSEALLKAEVVRSPRGEFSLLETTRWDPHLGARHLALHLERAARSARYFDIPFDRAEIRAAIGRAVKERTRPALLRILVDRTGWVSVQARDLPGTSDTLRLAVDELPVDKTDPFLRHKTTTRRRYQQARDRRPDADDVILWNADGEVTETTIGNLALCLDGSWVTPPLSSGLLAGTERSARLAAGELTEQVVSIEALERATGLARLNSVRGWEEGELTSRWWPPAHRPPD